MNLLNKNLFKYKSLKYSKEDFKPVKEELRSAPLVETLEYFGIFDLPKEIKISKVKDSIIGEKTEASMFGKVYNKAIIDGDENFTVNDNTDLIRLYIELDEYGLIPLFMDLVKKVRPDAIVKFTCHPDRGFRRPKLYTWIDGVCAEIQLGIPMQEDFDKAHHKLYRQIRTLPKDSLTRQKLNKVGEHIYDFLWTDIDTESVDTIIQEKVESFGNKKPRNRLPNGLGTYLSQPVFKFRKGKLIDFDEKLLADQVEVAHEYTLPRQVEFIKLTKKLYDEYRHDTMTI